jgi:formylglycine-generating enzyme required for sulfatase activity
LRYCTNCGEQIPKSAKFCAFCGEQQQQLEPIREEHKEPAPSAGLTENNHTNGDSVLPSAMLLDPGSLFQGYQIERIMNKDVEGIKYLAGKNGERFVLKLFFKERLTSLDTIYALQMRLSRLNKLDDSHTARVVEVNQTHDPAYMVSRFVSGKSLAQIKKSEPDRLNEAFVRDIALQLAKTAIAVRKQGLTLSNITLHGIMIDPNGRLVVLSSAISYEEVDEREDVFAIGSILAQILSTNRLFSTFYTPERLRASKFAYIQGVSLSMNKVLAECLHRTITQRYGSLHALLNDLENLPPSDADEIWSTPEKSPALITDKLNTVPKPKSPIEMGFIIIVAVVLLILFLMLTTNIFSFLFNRQNKTNGNQKGNRAAQIADSLSANGINAQDSLPGRGRNGYQDSGQNLAGSPNRNDPRLNPVPSRLTNRNPITPKSAPSPNPATMVRIDSRNFTFGDPQSGKAAAVFKVNTFYISKFEVTQKEWNAYMKPAETVSKNDMAPVHGISWLDAIEYCNKRSTAEGLDPVYTRSGSKASGVACNWNANGYRLPTEAEWEMAARAGTSDMYSGSNDPATVARYKDNSKSDGKLTVWSIGSKNPNDWGLYDMSGNVAEWCWDWYISTPGSASEALKPYGPGEGTEKVYRGGSIADGAGDALKIITRRKTSPEARVKYVGLRLVRAR